MSKFCCMPACEEELSEHARLDECKNCRASMNVWRKRGIRAILERRERLKKYDGRMERIAKPRSVPAAPTRRKAGGAK